jgi:hypothetical protein
MNHTTPPYKTLKHVHEEADEMGFMPRADLFTAALEGVRKGNRDQSVSEAICRVAAVENSSELNTFLGLPIRRKA